MTSQFLLKGHKIRYQQTVKNFPFGCQWSSILANKKLSKISVHRHFKDSRISKKCSSVFPYIQRLRGTSVLSIKNTRYENEPLSMQNCSNVKF